MEPKPDVSVVVPESFLQWAEPIRYVCIGIALLVIVGVVLLFVRNRQLAK